jgi:hypothetical protein
MKKIRSISNYLKSHYLILLTSFTIGALQLYILLYTLVELNLVFSPEPNPFIQVYKFILSELVASLFFVFFTVYLTVILIEKSRNNLLSLAKSQGITFLVVLLLFLYSLIFFADHKLQMAIYHDKLDEISSSYLADNINIIISGRRPLQHAIYYKKKESVDRLLRAGAKPELVDSSGRNSFDYAKDSNSKEIIELIKEYQ